MPGCAFGLILWACVRHQFKFGLSTSSPHGSLAEARFLYLYVGPGLFNLGEDTRAAWETHVKGNGDRSGVGFGPLWVDSGKGVAIQSVDSGAYV